MVTTNEISNTQKSKLSESPNNVQDSILQAKMAFLSKLLGLTDPIEIARITYEHLRSLMPCDAGAILLYFSDDPKAQMENIYSFDTDESGVCHINENREPIVLKSDTSMGIVLQTGQEIIIFRDDTESELQNHKDYNITGFNSRISRSLTFWPLMIHGKILGVFTVQSYKPNAYEIDDLSILRSTADALSLALANARAAEALKISESRYQSFYVDAQVGLFRTRFSDGKIIDCNNRFAEVLGYVSKEECIEHWVASEHYVEPGTRERMLAELKAKGEFRNFEVQISGKGDTLQWVRYSGKLYPEKGVIEGLAVTITEEKHAQQRLSKINECFLNFSPNPLENIQSLTALCGDMLGASCAIYNRLEKGMLCSIGKWNTPEDFSPVSSPDGHICYDVIKRGVDDSYIVQDLPHSKYAVTDPNIAKYSLQTYIGNAVKCDGKCIGSLCVVYQNDTHINDAQLRALSIVASAIGIEEQRRKAQAESSLFKLGIERSNEAIYLTDEENRIVYTNPAFEKIFGYSKEEIIFQTPALIEADNSDQETNEKFRNSLRDKDVVLCEIVNKTKDGELINIAASVNPLLDDDGDIIGSLVIGHNVTERNKAATQLRIEKAYLERLFESAPEAIVVVDNCSKIMQVNSEFTKMFGYSPDEAIGRCVDDLVAPGTTHESAFGLTIKVAGGENISVEDVRYRKDGTPVYVSILATPIVADGGQIAVYGIYRDITLRKKAEEALRQNERFLNNVFDGIQDGISVLDANFNIVHVNKAMEKLFPSMAPLAGKKCYQVYNQRTEPCNECCAVKVIKECAPQFKQVNFPGQDGCYKWLEISSHPLIDKNGNVTEIIEFVRDVTEKKKNEELLTARTEFLSKLVGLSEASEIANLVFQHMRQFMTIDAGGLVMSWANDDKYELVYSIDTDENGEQKIVKNREMLDLNHESRTFRVLVEGEKEIRHRTEKEQQEAIQTNKGITAFNNRISRSLAFFPLKLHGRSVGVISFQSYQADVFNEYRINLIESILTDLTLALTAVRMSEAIKEEEERYRVTAEQTGQILYDYDVKSGRIKWTGAVEAITGYTLEEFQKFDIKMWMEAIHPDEKAIASTALEQAMKDKHIYSADYRLRCIDGKYICIADNGVFLKDKEGKPYRMLGTMKDITERRLAEDLLQQSEEKYRSLIETMPNGLTIIDLNENIVFANQTACQIFGYSHNELIGMNLTQIVNESELIKFFEETEKRMRGYRSEFEQMIKTKEGAQKVILVIAVPHFNNNDEVIGSIAIFSDITEFKNSEIEKQELREKLTRAQRMESLGVLAGGVAHDLNNILGPLVAYPELIRMKLPPDSPINRQISKIESSAQRAAEVVQDLLTLARRGRYEMSPVNLNKIIESYIQSPDYYDLKMRFPSITTKIELDEKLSMIYGSSAHLYKVILNLIINAFDAMPHGGLLTVKTECRHIDKLIGGYDNIESGRYAILTISDNGVGIDKKDYKRLFEPFYTKKEMGKSGSGLGLAIVYGVVKDHNGYIDVQSELNCGSDFILYFPATTDKATQEKSGSGEIRGRERILIVDDVQEQRDLAAAILGSLGYKAKAVANGHEAVEYFKANSADVLILDMIMEPGFDGLDTYKAVLELRPGQKAIITSGFSETDRVKEAEILGVGKYIRKPYTMQKLGKAIREILDTPDKAKS
jgi:PAS domain S-box-containing protein